MIQEGVSILAHPLYFSSSNKCGFNLMVCAKIRAPSVPEKRKLCRAMAYSARPNVAYIEARSFTTWVSPVHPYTFASAPCAIIGPYLASSHLSACGTHTPFASAQAWTSRSWASSISQFDGVILPPPALILELMLSRAISHTRSGPAEQTPACSG